jgi:L-histidine Nalpha-methyltransferase
VRRAIRQDRSPAARARARASPAARLAAPGPDLFLRDVLAGLGSQPKSLPSRYFYDPRGSRIFQWITNLPDYYLTGAEREILEQHREEIAAPLARRRCTVVDLGAGDGHKTRLLLERLRQRCPSVTYAPLDVSEAALEEATERVRGELPGVKLLPVLAEYGDGLRRLSVRQPEGVKLVLFLGSSIGNLERDQARGFLRELRGALRPGDHVLVGFDLVKRLDALQRAYDDPQGVTALFNLNLLARINRELGADFDLSAFRHRATWDPRRPAMESWLESTRRQTVHLAGHAIDLGHRERIHTEISCKYRDADVADFASEAGFAEVGLFHDARRWFADALWRVD